MAEDTKEERLNNDEFRELIPYLELEDLFKIQIINEEKWIKLFESLLIHNKEIMNCNICKTHVEFESFKLHLKEQTHKDALKDVKQFYHPIYTYDKKSEKLALGESVSDEEMAEAIKAAKAGLEEQSKSIITEAKRLSKLIQNLSHTKVISLQVDEIMKITCFRGGHKFTLVVDTRNDLIRCNLCQSKPFSDFDELNVHFKTMEHINKSKTLQALSSKSCPKVNKYAIIQADTDSEYAIQYNEILIKLLEKEKVNKPHLMRLFCDLELEDILNLKVMCDRKSWKPMFKQLGNQAVFKCLLCNKTIIKYSLNSHCAGKQHKTAQLAAKVRHDKYKKITNSYIFALGAKYKVTASLKAREIYNNKVLEILKKTKKAKVLETKENKEDKKNIQAKENETENEAEIEQENKDENDVENETEENQDDENVEAEENQNSENMENEETQEDENVETEGNQNNENLEIEESKNKKSEEKRDDENVETKQSEESTTKINENDNSAQQMELSIKIAAKAKALRDASLNDRKIEAKTKKSTTRDSKLNTKTSENITPDNALVGVEYVVKILKHAHDQEPLFECCLCEVVVNHYRMQNHLTGYSHRYKYCEMHYGNAFTKFSAYLKGVKSSDMIRTMGPILSKLALEIEKVNGRSIPYAVSAEEFEVDRSRIIAQLYSDKHACQLFGPSFTNIFNEADIKKILDEKDSYKVPKTDGKGGVHCRFRELSRGQSYCNIKLKSERNAVFSYRAKSQNEKEPHYRTRGSVEISSKRPRAETPPRTTLQNKGLGRNISKSRLESSTNNVWNEYRREILLSASQIERDYKEYRKCPDSHPLYDQEWNRFWKQRKDDLVSRGIDPHNYNFQTDWVPYFRNRLEELFGEALEQAKIDVRVRLNIPLDAIEDSNIALHQRSDRPSRTGSQSRVETSRSIRREPPPAKKSRFNTEALVMQWNSQTKYGQNTSRDLRLENRKGNNKISYASTLRDDGKPDLVHVLRLMTAFEDYLGSLGPKVTDLLFATLTLEKQIPNDSNLLEQKILTPNNCSLLETAMEKLKGTLLAGLMDSSKQPGLNQVIDSTTNLLTYADNMGYLKQFPTNQGVSQGSRNSQYSSNIQELMNIMTDVKSTGSNRLNNIEDFSGSNPYAPPNTGNRYPDFQNQQFGNMGSSSNVASKVSMNLNPTDVLSDALRNRFDRSNNNAPREHFSNPQMSQRNMNMPGLGGNAPGNLNVRGLGGNAPGNLNMANFGRNNYNNPNLNNQNANNNDRNNINNKANLQNTGPVTSHWKPFPGGNAAQSLQQNSNGRMWQQNNGSAWQSGSGMPGMQQQNFNRQQQQRQNR